MQNQSPVTIKATCSGKGIGVAPLLFDGKPETIIHELLQNARRAGATEVLVLVNGVGNPDTPEHTWRKSSISIEDNGTGIKNPETLLSLWDSGWDGDVQDLESPAGAGLFSLCRQGARISSGNWTANLTPDVFRGREEAQGEILDPPIQGTRIETIMDESPWNLRELVTNAARYYPVPVFINGEKVSSEDFLIGASFIVTSDSMRIGIYRNEVSDRRYGHRGNFYGLPVPVALKSVDSNTIRVDIYSGSALDLTLPSRNAMVFNEKWNRLVEKAEEAEFRYYQDEGVSHRMEYDTWKKAIDLGYKIDEARATLVASKPGPIYDNVNSYEVVAIPKDNGKTVVTGVHRSTLACLLFVEDDSLVPPMFAVAKKLEGYSWYPRRRLVRIDQVMKIGGKKLVAEHGAWEDFKDGEDEQLVDDLFSGKIHPDSIEYHLHIEDAEGYIGVTKVEGTLAFDSEKTNKEGVSGAWATTPGFWPDVEELQALFYNPQYSDDEEGESFQQFAEDEILRRSVGPTADKEAFLRRYLCEPKVREAMKAMDLSSIKILRDGNVMTLGMTRVGAPGK